MLNNCFLNFENDVMNCIIKENPAIENELRLQYVSAQIVRREFTQSGFYTTFKVDTNLKLKSIDKAVLGNVQAKINNLKFGVGFALYINCGLLDTLECYTYDECFPKAIMEYHLII